MPEAEDLIIDAARHATVFARALWRRHRQGNLPEALTLADVALRLDMLNSAIFGESMRMRIAQPPAPPALLVRLFGRQTAPLPRGAIPATDGVSIWLPRDAAARVPAQALRYYRCMALTQAARAHRGAPALAATLDNPLVRSVYLLLEARAVDDELARSWPGLADELDTQRDEALVARPPLADFSPPRRPLEQFARHVFALRSDELATELGARTHASAVLARAREVAEKLTHASPGTDWWGGILLYLDDWTGDLRTPSLTPTPAETAADEARSATSRPTRSARLTRSPEVRMAREDEDDPRTGAWMIQTTQPHEHAEDPLGVQRPTDRDEQAAAEAYADSLSELVQARLVRTPGHAKEYLLSADGLERASHQEQARASHASAALVYPEWDFRSQSYRQPGACVRQLRAGSGSLAWVTRTTAEHGAMIEAIRRQFQLLRSRRTKQRKQEDGDELDLDAYIEMRSDLAASRPTRQAIYQTERAARRETALLLLVDVSGSTDSWVGAHRRVIDVEKEALLLVCIALAELGDPFSVLTFSGESAEAVNVQTLKSFDEPYSMDVAARIGALEPDAYTRAGAALRHAAALLMKQPAQHRLLLLLSDGRPNDVDQYEGRYGIEDMQQAVIEAKLQGIHPFCLTVDRQASTYLPHVFGAGFLALLPRPELLPTALLSWLRHFVIT